MRWERMILTAMVMSAMAHGADKGPDRYKLVHEAVIDAAAERVWEAWTTKEGIESWMVAKGDIDLRVGGKMRSTYDPNGVLGDDKTIENTILSFEPQRMLSIKATRAPVDFPFKAALDNMWTVIHLDDLGNDRTRVTITGLGFTDDEESLKMRVHFDSGNAYTLKKLQQKFARAGAETNPTVQASSSHGTNPSTGAGEATSVKRIELETVVRGTLKDAWDAWTTVDGIRTFFAPNANIELRPGGAYEILFMADAPKGSRGAEDCNVLLFRPMEMLAFTWSAPPQWPELRKERTVVVLQFQDLNEAGVRVTLTHLGFGDGKGWDEVHDYFTKAWPVVLGRLKDRPTTRAGGG